MSHLLSARRPCYLAVQRGAGRQSHVDLRPAWPYEAVSEPRTCIVAPARQLKRVQADQYRTAHHEAERWIPGAGDVEKADDLDWIGHAGQRQAKTEQGAADQREHDFHRRPASRITNTVSTAQPMNVATAASERPDSRARPQTPCPDAQPFPRPPPTPPP